MPNNREIIKYIIHNIWSSWNPMKWSPYMQFAAVSCTLSCLIGESEASDVPLSDAEKESKLSEGVFTFRALKLPPSHYMKHAQEIPICLKSLKMLKKLQDLGNDNYVPAEALVSSKFIQNFHNLLKYFNLALWTGPNEADSYYFSIWTWPEGLKLLKHFAIKLNKACDHIDKAQNHLQHYNAVSSDFYKVINEVTHCDRALIGCNDIKSDIYYDNINGYI